MKRFLTTTALATLLAGPLAAASDGDAEWKDTFRDMAAENHIYASNFIGSRVYVSEAEISETSMNEADAEWDDVGEINDVLLTHDGRLDSILVDVGGFLGIGEKTVAVQMERLKLVSDGDDPDEYFVVFGSDRAALENAPEFQPRDGMDDGVTEASAEGGTAETMDETAVQDEQTAQTDSDAAVMEEDKPAEGEMAEGAAAEDRPAAGYPAAPELALDGYDTVVADEVEAETLTGAAVYDVNSEWIGEVSNLIVDTDGRVTDAVIDVGGFLGIGEKPVKVSFDSLTLKQAGDSGELRVYIDASEEQMKEMPEYEG